MNIKIFYLMVIAAVMLSCSPTIYADEVTKPYTFTAGELISASKMNANFDVIYATVNGHIGGYNLAKDTSSLFKVSGGAMMAFEDGTIGIGSKESDAIAHVKGNTDGTGAGVDAILHVQQNHAWTTDEPWALYVDGYSYLGGFRLNAGAGVSGFHKTATGGQLGFSTLGDDPITFSQLTNGEKMRIDSGGNVGIGTKTPSAALEVDGTVKITKKLEALDKTNKVYAVYAPSD